MSQVDRPLPEPVHYSVDEAVALLGVSKPTLYSLIRKDEAPPSYNVGRRRFFPKGKFHQWLDSL